MSKKVLRQNRHSAKTRRPEPRVTLADVAAVGQARAELTSVREDLDRLTTLAVQVAQAARDGSSVDHQTAVELVAHVADAVSALRTAEACLVESAASGK